MDIKTLIAVATGEIPHNYRNGLCPDELQPESRDQDCQACKILIEAATEHDAMERRLREAERWRDAVIDQLDVMHITCTRHKDAPAFAVHDCMAYSVNLALDPAVSEQAQALLDAGREAARAELEKQEPIAWYCDGEDGREYNGSPQMSCGRIGIPLYAAPTRAAPVRLTDGQLVDAACNADNSFRAIETAVLRANGFDIQPARGEE